ncbi:ty1-copia retrotransposon protein [Cucumis melo var. makuwa]|uniref:Ty1-copia retrotransposon protein n=1 Tax=Cucumis melo var. makuwa TaxID=1194695 RepID=A0A5D3BNY1_CUCMM|nr:ty1-copia retrotransposon protein [Cucumis melo var. makuwa]TYK00855.1 ty1-copia retrotransposon protein [Cucumis melo var. makuwa]
MRVAQVRRAKEQLAPLFVVSIPLFRRVHISTGHGHQGSQTFFQGSEVDYVLTTDLPSDPQDQVIDPEKYAKDNKTVHGHLLNHMSDLMFDPKWLQFQMTDNKPVVDQIHAYENLVANVLFEGVKMCEILEANVLLEKDRTKQDKEQKGKNSKKRQLKAPRGQIKKKKLVCYVREKGHNYCGDQLDRKKADWILDTDPRDTSAPIENFSMTTKILQMENAYSWETQPLHENLVSRSLLNRVGLKIVLEGDKVVLTKNREFVDKGYLSNGLFVLNTVSMNANAFSPAYIVESVDLWHGRLGHMNFDSIRKLKDLRLINTSESHGTDEDPKTYREALNSIELSMWKEAIKSELDSLIMNQTWDSVDLSMGKGYCDANWVINNDEVNSTSGYVFLLEVAICIAKNSVYNGKRRHIRLKHAAVKQLLKKGTISLEFIRSQKNLADPLTKGLTKKVVLDSLVNMGLKSFRDL